MDIEYDDESLELLASDPNYRGEFGRDVVKAFRKRIQVIRAAPDERARMIAANNVLNAGFMVLGSAVAAGLAAWGLGAPAMLRLLAGLNVPVAIAFAVGRWRSR